MIKKFKPIPGLKPKAKHLTVRYFSIVAIAIVLIHYSVLELTMEDLEQSFVQMRLDKTHDYLTSKLANTGLGDIDGLESFELQTQGNTDFDKNPTLILNLQSLPSHFPDPKKLPFNIAVAVEGETDVDTQYVMRIKLEGAGQSQDAILVMDNGLYELSENQAFLRHSKQILISVLLLAVSLWVVIKISDRLTQPISAFARAVSRQRPEDLSAEIQSVGVTTQELEDMITVFNDYQFRIADLLERERAFNRYASHELRSPLTVIRGAANLLGELKLTALEADDSNKAEFFERQRQRILKASMEMTEFIETLLSLTKPVDGLEITPITVDTCLLEQIVKLHEHLLKGKSIKWDVKVSEEVQVVMPEPALRILLGNLIKNAFAYTQAGGVTVVATPERLDVIDTGVGFTPGREHPDGFGLGLLLVRDLCRRFGYAFEIVENDKGSRASIILNTIPLA